MVSFFFVPGAVWDALGVPDTDASICPRNTETTLEVTNFILKMKT